MYQRQTLKFYDTAPDLIPQDTADGVWNDQNNTIHKNGETVRISADAQTLASATAVPRTLVYARYGETRFWIYANETGIWCNDGTTETDITPAGWAVTFNPEVNFTSCVLAGIVYVNASDRAPVYWAGDPLTACQPLPDWPSGETCNALRSHKNFLFAIGMLDQNGQRVRWSDAAEPGTVPQFWTPDSSNLAGFVDLAPLSAEALDGMTLRDDFVVYKSEGIHSFTFVGGNTVFAVRQIFAEYGISAVNAVTLGNDDMHVFIGDSGDVFLTDGVQVRSALDGKAQRKFYTDYSTDPNRKVQCQTLSREKLAILFYPRNTHPDAQDADRALVYNFVDGSVGFRDAFNVTAVAQGAAIDPVPAGGSWDDQTDTWETIARRWNEITPPLTIDDVVHGDINADFWVLGGGGADPVGREVAANATKEGVSFGRAQMRKTIGRVWPKIEGQDGDVVEIRVGGQEITGGDISYTSVLPFTIGQDRHLDVLVSGRFMALQVSSLGGSVWRMGSIDVEYREQGKF